MQWIVKNHRLDEEELLLRQVVRVDVIGYLVVLHWSHMHCWPLLFCVFFFFCLSYLS